MARAESLEQETFACQETVADETAVAGPVVITATEALANCLCVAAAFRAQSGVPGIARRTALDRADAQSVVARGGYCAAVGEAVPTRSALATDRAA